MAKTEANLWNTVAPSYNDEIFDVFRNDQKGIIKRLIKKHSGKNKLAIDFGCGNGKAISLLSPAFKNILAVDISQELIDIAKETYDFKNVQYKRVDLATPTVNLPLANFAICCNVAISGNTKRNYRIIKNVMDGLKKGGTAVIVIPSLESACLSAQQLVDWYRKEGIKLSEIPDYELTQLNYKNIDLAKESILFIEDTPTKHYSYTELFTLLKRKGFSIELIDKLEYDWSTEFDSPPSWMKAPYPWDWIVEVKKV